MTNFADFFLEGVQLEMLSIFDQSIKLSIFICSPKCETGEPEEATPSNVAED